MPAPLLVVDAPYLLYRSFFALPDSIRGVDGHSVNALLGGTNVLLRAAADCSPRAIVLCFGAEAAAYRVELFSGYHADRPVPPDELQWQFDQAPAYFESFGWASIGHEALEADDLLGSLARIEAAAGGQTLILTGDRDMYQCADSSTTVLFLKAGKVGFDRVDPREVRARYGIDPALVPDFIALRGDPSDGLPGAPGIGPKSAAELLRQYGSLEGVLEHARDQTPKRAMVLREHADALRSFREIATLRIVEVERPADRATDLQAGAAAARRIGTNRLAERLEQAGSIADL